MSSGKTFKKLVKNAKPLVRQEIMDFENIFDEKQKNEVKAY